MFAACQSRSSNTGASVEPTSAQRPAVQCPHFAGATGAQSGHCALVPEPLNVACSELLFPRFSRVQSKLRIYAKVLNDVLGFIRRPQAEDFVAFASCGSPYRTVVSCSAVK